MVNFEKRNSRGKKSNWEKGRWVGSVAKVMQWKIDMRGELRKLKRKKLWIMNFVIPTWWWGNWFGYSQDNGFLLPYFELFHWIFLHAEIKNPKYRHFSYTIIVKNWRVSEEALQKKCGKLKENGIYVVEKWIIWGIKYLLFKKK